MKKEKKKRVNKIEFELSNRNKFINRAKKFSRTVDLYTIALYIWRLIPNVATLNYLKLYITIITTQPHLDVHVRCRNRLLKILRIPGEIWVYIEVSFGCT